MQGAPVPQEKQRTENTDRSNKGIKILPVKISFVEKGEKKKNQTYTFINFMEKVKRK